MKTPWYSIAKFGPLLIVAACLVDVVLRFTAPQGLWFRPWEGALTRITGEGHFRPLFAYDNPRSYGDLANLGNCVECRIYRREKFTTDELGYRNPPGSSGYTMLLTGDSFGGGSALNDEETLSSQLTAAMPGQKVYNAAGPLPDWPRVAKLLAAKGIRNSTVIWEHAEIHPYASGPLEPEPGAALRLMRRVGGGKDGALYKAAGSALRVATQYASFAPLQIFVQRNILRRLENDYWLPNPSGKAVTARKLANGSQMLFIDLELRASEAPHKPDLAYLRALKAAVEATGNKLLVVLAPSKFSVYKPLFENASAQQDAGNLAADAQAIAAIGVDVVDLTPAMRQAAADALRQNQLIYHADDTHWNPAGVKVAAATVAARLLR